MQLLFRVGSDRDEMVVVKPKGRGGWDEEEEEEDEDDRIANRE